MPLTADQYKTLIITEVGDDEASSLAAQMEIYWEMAGMEVARALPTLKNSALVLLHTYRYAKLKAIDLMLGKVRKKVTQTSNTGASTKLSELTDNLEGMRSALLDDIKSFEEKMTRAGRRPVLGMRSATGMTEPPSGFPDPNSAVYRGEPNAALLPERG